MYNQCNACDATETQLCKRCKSARYCSQKCQKFDWETHKILCKPITEFDMTSRPSEDHFRAILFPADKEKPEFVWLDCKPISDNSTDNLTKSEQHHDLGSLGINNVSHHTIQYNENLKKQLPNTLKICFEDGIITEKTPHNKCIIELIGKLMFERGGRHHSWIGPVIAYAHVGNGQDPSKCKDIDLTEFPHLVEHFMLHGYRPIRYWETGQDQPPNLVMGPAPELRGHKTSPKVFARQGPSPHPKQGDDIVKGVRINCAADQKLGRPLYEAVDVAKNDPVFTYHAVSEISDRLMFHLLTRPLPKVSGSSAAANNDTTNSEAAALHVCTDRAIHFNTKFGCKGFGHIPAYWKGAVGSVLVVREDREPLLPDHVESVVDYCLQCAIPTMNNDAAKKRTMTGFDPINIILVQIRPSMFAYWYDELFVAGKIKAEAEWDVRPPRFVWPF